MTLGHVWTRAGKNLRFLKRDLGFLAFLGFNVRGTIRAVESHFKKPTIFSF